MQVTETLAEGLKHEFQISVPASDLEAKADTRLVDLKDKVLKGAMDWPWGHAQCEASISLDRKLITAALSEAKYEANIGTHDIVCHLHSKDGKDRDHDDGYPTDH